MAVLRVASCSYPFMARTTTATLTARFSQETLPETFWSARRLSVKGMTGPSGSHSGFPLSHFAAEMKGEDVGSLPPFELSEGPTMLGAVWLRIEAGKTQEIRRVS